MKTFGSHTISCLLSPRTRNNSTLYSSVGMRQKPTKCVYSSLSSFLDLFGETIFVAGPGRAKCWERRVGVVFLAWGECLSKEVTQCLHFRQPGIASSNPRLNRWNNRFSFSMTRFTLNKVYPVLYWVK